LISFYLIISIVAGTSPNLGRSSFPKGFKFVGGSSAYQVPFLPIFPVTYAFIILCNSLLFCFTDQSNFLLVEGVVLDSEKGPAFGIHSPTFKVS
jgi:hypothetical protein